MIFVVAIAFLFIFEGLRASARSILWIFEWRQSKSWLSTPGIIIQSTLKSTLAPRGGRKGFSLSGSVRWARVVIPDIVYEYRVNIETFQSRQIFIGQQFPSSFNFSNKIIEKYPVGEQVEVFYNPEKPQVSTLESSRGKELVLSLFGGILYLLIGFAILYQVVRV